MKFLTGLLTALLTLLFTLSGRAAEDDAPAPETGPKAELKALVGTVQKKLRDNQRTEKELAEELKAFDALLAKYKDQKTDDVAQIAFMKAMLYVQVFDEAEKGEAMIRQLKQDFPGTKPAEQADAMLESMAKQAEARKIQKSLVVGSKFPDFEEQDADGKPLSISGYKGKVVLVDFWASWCGPCVKEMPNVIKAYDQFHPKGFDVVGISLDSNKAKMDGFIKEHKMPWRQYYDGKGWGNKLAGKYGVNSIPATYLLDAEGTIIGKNLRGEALVAAVEKALAKP